MVSLFMEFDYFFYLFLISLNMPVLVICSLLKMSRQSFLFANIFFSQVSIIYPLSARLNKFSLAIFSSLFNVILLLNCFSLNPFNFSMTTRLSVVLFFSIIMFFSMFLFTISFKLKKLLSHLTPMGAPLGMSIFLLLIEIISIMIRPATLTVRLVANITAGHVLLSLLSNLIINFYPAAILFFFLSLAELAVSFIQSYIFLTLVVFYYSDFIN